MMIKPVKKSGFPPLLQEIRGTGMTSFADEVVLSESHIQSEGQVMVTGEGTAMYSGSTMVTVELSRIISESSDHPDTPHALLRALERSISFRVGLMRIARLEAEIRSAPRLVREMATELEFTIVPGKLLVDIEVECPLTETAAGVDDTFEESQ